MKEIRKVIDVYKSNPDISLDEIIKIFGIKSNIPKNYIEKVAEVCSEYFPFITKQSILVIGYILNHSVYNVNDEVRDELYKLRQEASEFFLSKIKNVTQISKEQISDIKQKRDKFELLYRNGYNQEHETQMFIYRGLADCVDDCFSVFSVFNVKSFIKHFFRHFGHSFLLERYLIVNDLYTYDKEGGELRLGRGSIVGCCIPVNNLPDNLNQDNEVKTLNPRNKKEQKFTIIKQHRECKFTYLAFNGKKEVYITNSNEVDEAYDCLHDINRFIFAGYNWKRRLLIYQEI